MGNVKGSTSRTLIERKIGSVDVGESAKGPSEFLDSVGAAIPPLVSIDQKSIFAAWVKMYGDMTFFGLESGMYFAAALFSSVTSSYMCNDSAITAIAEEPAAKAYNEFFRVTR
jgi:hypothetical protein